MGLALIAAWLGAAAAHAQEAPPAQPSFPPAMLSLQPDFESVYAPPDPPDASQGVNEGGVHLDLTVSYMTDYVFRGLDQGETAALNRTNPVELVPPDQPLGGAEDSPNLQIDGRVEFDLGRAPHPFFGVFVNVFDADPESRFQEIRPFFGLELTLRPITFTAGHNSFIYPDRDDLNTTEAFGQITIDDSYFLNSNEPLLSPYVFAAYDYNLYDGLYLEVGVQHDWWLEEIGVRLTAQAHVAYVQDHAQFDREDIGSPADSGFQHYQFGLVGTYRLNPLLGIPQRYGDWNLTGYVYYTDGIDNELLSETQVWGGAGIGFSY